MDPSQSKVVLAEAIRQAYSDLFAINKKANELSAKEVSGNGRASRFRLVATAQEIEHLVRK